MLSHVWSTVRNLKWIAGGLVCQYASEAVFNVILSISCCPGEAEEGAVLISLIFTYKQVISEY